MTAGPGDQHDQQQGGGQPPVWPSPPPAQPHPQPGPNPYAFQGGKGWKGEVPKPVERPVTVRAGLGALLAAYFLGVVASIAMLVRFDDVLEWTARQDVPPLETPGLELDADQLAELVLRATIVVGIVVLALQLLFVWFAWLGHNWARITLWVFAGLALFSAPVSAAGEGGPLPFVTSLGRFETGLLVAAVVLLALSPSNDWYRYRSWQRATGQG